MHNKCADKVPRRRQAGRLSNHFTWTYDCHRWPFYFNRQRILSGFKENFMKYNKICFGKTPSYFAFNDFLSDKKKMLDCKQFIYHQKFQDLFLPDEKAKMQPQQGLAGAVRRSNFILQNFPFFSSVAFSSFLAQHLSHDPFLQDWELSNSMHITIYICKS